MLFATFQYSDFSLCTYFYFVCGCTCCVINEWIIILRSVWRIISTVLKGWGGSGVLAQRWPRDGDVVSTQFNGDLEQALLTVFLSYSQHFSQLLCYAHIYLTFYAGMFRPWSRPQSQNLASKICPPQMAVFWEKWSLHFKFWFCNPENAHPYSKPHLLMNFA